MNELKNALSLLGMSLVVISVVCLLLSFNDILAWLVAHVTDAGALALVLLLPLVPIVFVAEVLGLGKWLE